MSQNKNLSIRSRFVLNRFVATGSVYGINCVAVSFSAIKNLIWATFASHVLQSLQLIGLVFCIFVHDAGLYVICVYRFSKYRVDH